MIEHAWLIPLFPGIAFVIIGLITRPMKVLSALLAIAAMAGSLVVSVGIALEAHHLGITLEKPVEIAVDWLKLPGLRIEAGLLIDPLTIVMLLVVTSVALLVEIYSVGYMHGDPGFSTFFSYISLFASSMLGLVIANNYFMMYFFWELVGLCSYLLIGFYFHKVSASQASKKAFIVNRVGDFGFLLGFLVLFIMFGTFNFRELAAAIPQQANTVALTVAALLVLLGPLAKSAQFPLHVWLPDAMEGPTPVSALIHAATMVAAGVYLLARGYVLFASSHVAITTIAYIGGFTALFAASIALVQRDCKRVLAYSTISQLGYMVMAMGVGSLTAGMFHLTTHAFFKALLFLCAGSIIHALDEQDIFKMGGLYKYMKVTAWTMIIGSLSLSGIPPLAGFWSKDEILLSAFSHGHYGLYAIGTLVAFMTAFYMFRLIFLVFFGPEKFARHPHESPAVMTVPLVILAIFSVLVGFIGAPFVEHGFGSYIYFQTTEHAPVNYAVMGLSTLVALMGIGLAWLVYYKQAISHEALAQRFADLHNLLYRKFYVDELYHWIFAKVVLGLGAAFNWNDRHVVDGVFDGIGDLTKVAGGKLRLTETGQLQNYALVIFAACVIIAIWIAWPALGGIQ